MEICFLEAFHHQYMKCIMSCHQQLTAVGTPESLKSVQIEGSVEMDRSCVHMICNSHHLKKLLFSKLVNPSPFHGAKQCWKDVVTLDLKVLRILLDGWYSNITDRNGWCHLYTEQSLHCATCGILGVGTVTHFIVI